MNETLLDADIEAAPIGALALTPYAPGPDVHEPDEARMATAALAPAEKAAIVIVALGPEGAAEVLNGIGPKRVRRFAHALNKLSRAPAEVVDAVLAEFLALLTEDGGVKGGAEETRRFLAGALDGDQVSSIMNDLAGDRLSVWRALGDVDDARLAAWLTGEHRQVAAIALSRLPSTKAAEILQRLERDQAEDIVLRMGRTAGASAALAARIGEVIERDFLPAARRDQAAVRPSDTIASIMNHVPTELREGLLTHVGGSDPSLARDVEKRMFTFDHITARVRPRDVGLVAKAVDETTMLKALKAGGEAGPRTTEFFFENMSKRLSERLREDLEALETPKAKDGEAARAELVATITTLRDRGDITMVETDEDEA